MIPYRFPESPGAIVDKQIIVVYKIVAYEEVIEAIIVYIDVDQGQTIGIRWVQSRYAGNIFEFAIPFIFILLKCHFRL